MRQLREALFRLVVVSFSLALLVLGLLCAARTAAVSEEAAALETEVATLRTEEARLRADWESQVSLVEIERYATEILGMQRRSPGQIVVLPPEAFEG